MRNMSDQKLLAWLDDKPSKLERHLDEHPEDVARLDELTALDASAQQALQAFVETDEGFADRVLARLGLDENVRDALRLFGGLFGIGLQTIQQVTTGLPDEPRDPTHDTHDPEGDPT
jgi:hypothetical protein